MTPTASARAVGGVRPARTVTPRATAELASIIRGLGDAGQACVLWAGGTRIEVGDAPARYDVAVDLSALRGVVAHAPADLVCTVRAGTTLRELEDALAAAGQRWPVEAPDPDRATVGGTIASAAAGPSRLRAQHPRDWIIGCEAVLGDGTVARAGGRVVKNVTGYDLTRLYSGTFGTLAAITELTLKLVAAPERVASFVMTGDAPALWRAASELHASRLPVDAIALFTGERTILRVRLAGMSAAVDRLARELSLRGAYREEDAESWRDIASLPAREAGVLRLSLRPGRESETLAGRGGRLLAYPGTGIAYLFGAADTQAIISLRGELERAGGALVIERADEEVRRAAGTWGRPGLPGGIARALKERFDPRGVLAPGRIAL